jgi:hypothetical protein
MKKNIQIKAEIHEKFRIYCEIHRYKLGGLVEKLILEEINNVENE